MFGALQDAATYALNNYDDFLDQQNETFKRRRNYFEQQLLEAHLPFVSSKGGIYEWLHTPPGYDSETFEQFYYKNCLFWWHLVFHLVKMVSTMYVYL